MAVISIKFKYFRIFDYYIEIHDMLCGYGNTVLHWKTLMAPLHPFCGVYILTSMDYNCAWHTLVLKWNNYEIPAYLVWSFFLRTEVHQSNNPFQILVIFYDNLSLMHMVTCFDFIKPAFIRQVLYAWQSYTPRCKGYVIHILALTYIREWGVEKQERYSHISPTIWCKSMWIKYTCTFSQFRMLCCICINANITIQRGHF